MWSQRKTGPPRSCAREHCLPRRDNVGQSLNWRAHATRRGRGRRRTGRRPHAPPWVAAEHERGRGVERGYQLAEFARRREVLVLLGDADELDAVARRELGDHRSTRSSGALAPAVTPTIARDAERVEIELVGTVDPQHDGATGVARDLRRRDRVRRVRAADHDDRVGGARDLGERVLAVRRREAEVVARARSTASGNCSRASSTMSAHSFCASVVWASTATRSGSSSRCGRSVPRSSIVLDEPDRRRARPRACRPPRRGRRGRRRES